MRPTRGFRLLALAAAASAWALVAVGGIVRVTESGLGCPDWPLCDGRVVPAQQKEPIIETSHRWVAGLVTVLVVVVAVWAWRRYRSRRDVVVPAVTAVLLIPAQALLGAIVVWLELPGWIVGVHFVVGMLFLAATVLTAGAAWCGAAGVRANEGFVRLASWTAGVGLVLVALGAAVVSADADHACGENWPDCNGAFAGGGADAWLQVAHRSAAYLVAGLALALAVQAWRGRGPRLAGSAPLAAVAVQIAFGVSLVLVGEESAAHEPLAMLHVAGAATVWATLVGLVALVGLPRHERLPAALTARAR
ncbi:MAG TPA: COX15/CtaA family protein [Gaiellaceae bacterium]|nr:COX15/CtaA family protein [Gaiellaceae bacterium]